MRAWWSIYSVTLFITVLELLHQECEKHDLSPLLPNPLSAELSAWLRRSETAPHMDWMLRGTSCGPSTPQFSYWWGGQVCSSRIKEKPLTYPPHLSSPTDVIHIGSQWSQCWKLFLLWQQWEKWVFSVPLWCMTMNLWRDFGTTLPLLRHHLLQLSAVLFALQFMLHVDC